MGSIEDEVNQLRIRVDRLEQREYVKWADLREWVAVTLCSSPDEVLAWLDEKITGPKPPRLADTICVNCNASAFRDAGPFCGTCGSKLP